MPKRLSRALRSIVLPFIILVCSGCATLYLHDVPPSTYKLGHLAITLPDFMIPRVDKFWYKWYAFTPDRRDHLYGYPISLEEHTYVDKANVDAESMAAIDKIRQRNKRRMIYECDVSGHFKSLAYYLCFGIGGGEYRFMAIIRQPECLLYLTSHDLALEKPDQKECASRLLALVNFFQNYHSGHDSGDKIVFYTYYGYITGAPVDYFQKMSLRFSNGEDTINFYLKTDVNPGGRTEANLEDLMKRMSWIGHSAMLMRNMPNFPGRYLVEWDDKRLVPDISRNYHRELTYYGQSARLPSVTIHGSKGNSCGMGLFRATWDFLIDNIRPLHAD